MREIRPSGSEGGGAGTNRPSLPLFVNCPYGAKTYRAFAPTAPISYKPQNANTSGETLKYLASLPMWLRFKARLPLRISEIVESAIPVAAEMSV